MAVLWLITQILAGIILYPAYLDCKNFWYCHLYNESDAAIEFVTLLIMTVADAGIALLVLAWTVATRLEVTDVQMRTYAQIGKW